MNEKYNDVRQKGIELFGKMGGIGGDHDARVLGHILVKFDELMAENNKLEKYINAIDEIRGIISNLSYEKVKS